MHDVQAIHLMPWSCEYLASARGGMFRALVKSEFDPSRALLICPPLGEEAKASFQILAGFSGQVWASGWNVSRFDYLGTGDSEGVFEETTPEDWLEDGRRALDDLLTQSQPRQVVVMGLRLGANIAAHLAKELSATTALSVGLVLWEPILHFGQFHRRLKWINRNPASKHGIDAFGWHYSKQCLSELEPTLSIEPNGLTQPLFAAFLNGSNGSIHRLCGLSPVTPDPKSQWVEIKTPPFWELIGAADATPLTQASIAWLKEFSTEESAAC